jgi:hypothetical protein
MRNLILILLLVPLRGTALQIVNGGFELPTLTTTQNISGPFTIPGWSGIAPSNGGNAGLVVGPNNGLTPAEGLQHFTFNGGNPSDQGYLEQTLATTAGTAYELAFALGRAGGGQSLSVTTLLLDGANPITTQSFLPPATSGYQYHTLAFTAPSAATTLRFLDTSGPNSISDLYLDAITVTPTAAPVPDTPSVLGQFLLILALLLITRPRRSLKTQNPKPKTRPMWHHPSFTLEIDCRRGTPPAPGDTFSLRLVTEEQFEVLHVAPYRTPQRREDGTMATHHIRYRRKPK